MIDLTGVPALTLLNPWAGLVVPADHIIPLTVRVVRRG